MSGALRARSDATRPWSTRLRLLAVLLCVLAPVSDVLWAAPVRPEDAGTGSVQVHGIRPSEADPRVRDHDQPSYAFFSPAASPLTPLVVYLPGTGGVPSPTSVMGVFAARLGYRALVLDYDDTPAVSEVCPKDPDPLCSQRFREMRTTGEGGFERVVNPMAEAIIPRLRAALLLLSRQHPQEGWDQYLLDGEPDWSRLVVSGLSQGAGMAAYLAQRHRVARVVLFSSPWDVTGPDRRPAPWLSEPSQTPPDRWFAEYHERENTARLIANAYRALAIPSDHVFVFRLDLPGPAARFNSPNPFHGITTRDPRYAPEWRAMFGDPRAQP